MSTLIYSFSKTSLPNGVTNIPPTALGAGALSISAQIARCTTADNTIWANASTTLTCDLQVSYDNQATWQEAGSFTDSGGIRNTFKGEMALSSVGRSFPNAATHIKGTITVTNGPCVTSGNVWVN